MSILTMCQTRYEDYVQYVHLCVIKNLSLVLETDCAVIYSLGEMEGQVMCHHGYFIKPWMCPHTAVSTPLWSGCYYLWQNPALRQTNYTNTACSVTKSNYCPREKSSQDDNDEYNELQYEGLTKFLQNCDSVQSQRTFYIKSYSYNVQF